MSCDKNFCPFNCGVWLDVEIDGVMTKVLVLPSTIPNERINEFAEIFKEEVKDAGELQFENIQSTVVDIRDFKFITDATHNTATFNLVNITEPNQQTRGYLDIVFLNDLVKKAQYYSHPQNIELDDMYKIKNYIQGDPFSIKYFKKVNIQIPPQDFSIKYILIRVHSRSGQLLYQTIKSVKNVN